MCDMSKEPTPFLRDYQLEAVNKGCNGCIFNGGVGSGKSRTGLYYYFKANGGSLLDYDHHVPMPVGFGCYPQDLYIITTAMKRDNCEWELELANFYMSTKPEINPYDNKIVIDSWNNIKRYVDVVNAFFIFDEDKITGTGAWVHAFWKIAKNNNWIVLSATPGDTWMDYMPIFVANGFYKNQTEFTKEHAIYARYTKWPQIEGYMDTGRLVRLRNKILINMDFERTTVPHHININTSYNISEYKKIVKTRWDPYKDEPIAQASSLCYVLRRLVNTDESRVNALLDILEQKQTAIIFYNFDYELDMLHQVFWNSDNDIESCDYESNNKFEVAEWNGHAHQEIPRGKKWVYLVQYTAGCEGWNCITTDTVIFFSQNYSYKVITQAAGRIDRLNTPYKNLFYYHLKSFSSIDIAIARAVENKKKFNEGKWCNSQNKKFAKSDDTDRFAKRGA